MCFQIWKLKASNVVLKMRMNEQYLAAVWNRKQNKFVNMVDAKLVGRRRLQEIASFRRLPK